ncbi:hypothetical protein [Streptomyces orinoci]|uniref:Uncharacterized protein n=1 Tax=Streptomyces orinoci TaxID=67339 RepID=A0ABV3JYX1_STRON|nr:hypothetical protein [Streptomyces orinoci]
MNPQQINAIWRGIQQYHQTPCVECHGRSTWPNAISDDHGRPLLLINCDDCGKVSASPLVQPKRVCLTDV